MMFPLPLVSSYGPIISRDRWVTPRGWLVHPLRSFRVFGSISPVPTLALGRDTIDRARVRHRHQSAGGTIVGGWVGSNEAVI